MTSESHITKELFDRYSCAVELDDENILLYTRSELSESSDIRNLLGLVSEERNGYWLHKARFATLNAFALRYALKGKIGRKTRIIPEHAKKLATYADRVELPTAKMAADGKAVELLAPNLKVYRELFVRLGATPTKDGHRLRLDKVIDLELHINAWKSNLPPIELHKDLLKLNREPIPGFDGTVDSLREIPIGALNIVRANVQNWQALKKSSVTMEEKLAKFKLGTLHDLLFRLPRRYIDKSKPQLIDDLIEGESATIIGRVTAISSFSTGVGGLRLTVQDPTGGSINSTFWRQGWLQKKFKIGDEVLLTGAVSSWNGKVQLNGQTVEHFDEGTTLAIVPIYRQSESAGITSAFLISSIRELLQRLGDVKLPVYFKAEGRQAYRDMLTEFHTPSSLEAHEEAILAMAYYELIYMQLLIQDAKANTEKRPGLILAGGEKGLQLKAAKALPYDLTGAQRKAVAKLNKKLADKYPSSSLLMADVGAGKTVVAQLACLQAVDSGAQAVIVAPTDVLARQLHEETVKLAKLMKATYDVDISVVLMAGAMKAAEKKELNRQISSGEADIVVGTQAVFSSSVKYQNLGLVVIDEQQKFGAEQRTKLLESREDGKVPDLLLQTATPIPRSMAQVYYADLEPITMKEKPGGRLPIATEWIQDDPVGILHDPLHPMWLDIMAESQKGNQSFVITPMVVESTKVDAASVERAYKELSSNVLSHLRVGYVHGQMKMDEQRATMERFKNKELDVLVASTVIEVGVNIPDATRMVILSAERMGASSLHQIRGRVGRNSKPSKCYLVSLGKTESSVSRLQSLVDHEDGFEIAKVDLQTRGEGTMFSSDQSGRSDMIFANLAKHSNLIGDAKEEALRILRSPFKALALKDAREKFTSPERLF